MLIKNVPKILKCLKLTQNTSATSFLLKRTFSAEAKSNPKIPQKSQEDSCDRPYLDWDDWIRQYPEFARKEAEAFMKKCKKEEISCDIDENSIPKIDWDKWRKLIKTPRAVDILKAEYDSYDFTTYSPFYYDKLTEESRNEILKPGSEYEKEIEMVGRDYVINGVEKSLKKESSKRIESTKELVEISILGLEELEKDKEQLEMTLKRFHDRSMSEDMAEYPDVAREIEENIAGNGYGNGMSIFPNDVNREVDISREKEDRFDKDMAEYSLREANDQIDDYMRILKSIGFDVSKEDYIECNFEGRQRFINRLRDYCRETRSNNSYDPETGKLITRDFDDRFTHIPGGG